MTSHFLKNNCKKGRSASFKRNNNELSPLKEMCTKTSHVFNFFHETFKLLSLYLKQLQGSICGEQIKSLGEIPVL